MGTTCSRRRSSVPAGDIVEGDWIVVGPQPPAALSAARFRRVVRRIVVLLRIRQIWANLGRQLQTANPATYLTYDPQSGTQYRASIRLITRPLWSTLGVHVRASAELFRHLERKKGRLVHRRA